jgi:DNA-binding XRE family transcriptional regulator
MITPTQMRAARAMLDVPQGHVAEHLGIAANTLSKIESGQSDVSMSRMSDIQRFYEREGIAFMENDGVKWNNETFKIFKGDEDFRAFYDDLYNTVKDFGGDVCLYNGVSELVINSLGKDFVAKQQKRMSEIEKAFSYRVIVEYGDSTFFGSSYCEYKWMSQEFFNNKAFFVFGNKVAFANFDDGVQIIMIEQSDIAQNHRVLFDLAWNELAQDPSS